MTSSIFDLSNTSKPPGLCALSGCNKAAANVFCTNCNATPNLGTPGARLPDIAYCSAEHLKQDTAVHRQMCERRRWLRFVARIGELYDLIFATERATMFEQVAKVQESADGNTVEIEYRNREYKEQPFCVSDVDENLKLCALYLNNCAHAIQIGTPLMAFMSKQGEFRVLERHILVKPRKAVRARMHTGQEIRTIDVPHAVFFLAPPFLPTEEDAFAEDGVILDASAAQLCFFDTAIATAFDYLSMKAKSTELDPKRHDADLGACFKHHTNAFMGLDQRFYPALVLALEGSIRVVYNIVVPELEQAGGAQGVNDLDPNTWGALKNIIKTRLVKELGDLRSNFDRIDFSTVMPSDEALEGKRELMKQYEGDGYREVMALVEDLVSE